MIVNRKEKADWVFDGASVSVFVKKSAKLQSEVEVVAGLLHKCVEEDAHSALDKKVYQERYSSLVDRV